MVTDREAWRAAAHGVAKSRTRLSEWPDLIWYSSVHGISFPVVFSQSLWLRVLPGGAGLVQPRWMPERRILGGGWIRGVSFLPFLNPSVGGGLLVPCSLPGPPVLKQLMQMVTMVPGQRGFNQCASPDTYVYEKKKQKTLSAQTCTMYGREDSLCFA